jgi:hypothetical protein
LCGAQKAKFDDLQVIFVQCTTKNTLHTITKEGKTGEIGVERERKYKMDGGKARRRRRETRPRREGRGGEEKENMRDRRKGGQHKKNYIDEEKI